MIPASRSAPFLYTSLLTTTTVTEGVCVSGEIRGVCPPPLSLWLCEGSGVKHTESTALGMTETISGLRAALSTVFSLLCVCVCVCIV